MIGPDRQAVAITSTINLHFGSKLMTPNGIVLNNEMDDFSSPGLTNAFGYEPSPANFIEPGKSPLSSMVPTIVVGGDGEPVMSLGASGGSKIITATLNVMLSVLSFCTGVKVAVDLPRLHHQLVPQHIAAEPDVPAQVRAGLIALGHWYNETSSNGVCQAVVRGSMPGRADGSGSSGPGNEPLFAAADGRRKAGAAAAGY